MIEDIKKEVEHCFDDVYLEDKKFVIATFINILDKYKDKEDKYKKAWEELYSEKEKPCSIEYMQDLEEKYKIGVE